jgi:hypothetical protein
MTSYKPMFLCQGAWCGNAQRFGTREEALDAAKARFAVWTVPTEYRVDESSDPVNYVRRDGRDVWVEEARAAVANRCPKCNALCNDPDWHTCHECGAFLE